MPADPHLPQDGDIRECPECQGDFHHLQRYSAKFETWMWVNAHKSNMMRSERAEPVAVPSSAPTVKRLIVEPTQDGRGIVGVWDVTSLTSERLAELRQRHEREFVYARDYDALAAIVEAPVAVPAPTMIEGDTANVIGRAADLIRDLRTMAAEPIRETLLAQSIIERHLTSAVAKGVAIVRQFQVDAPSPQSAGDKDAESRSAELDDVRVSSSEITKNPAHLDAPSPVNGLDSVHLTQGDAPSSAPRGEQIGDGGIAQSVIRGVWTFMRKLTDKEHFALHDYISSQGGGIDCEICNPNNRHEVASAPVAVPAPHEAEKELAAIKKLAMCLRLEHLIGGDDLAKRSETIHALKTMEVVAALQIEIAQLKRGAVQAAPPSEPMAFTIDARCDCARCVARTENIYRMIGHCLNCGQRNILVLFRAGDPATSRDCPRCGKWHGVEPQRLATDDEIPAAAPSAAAQTPMTCPNCHAHENPSGSGRSWMEYCAKHQPYPAAQTPEKETP